MNLDDQLKEIARPDRSPIVKERTNQQIRMKLGKDVKSTNWSYRIILASVCVLALFFVLTINNSSYTDNEQSASPFGNIDEQTTIEKVTVLNNMNPQKNLNLDSIFYPLKVTSTENHNFEETIQILLSAKEKAVPWFGTIYDDYSIFDYQFQFSNNETLYLKLNTNQSLFLVDPQANMKYELTNEEWKLFNSLADEIYYGERWSTNKNIIMGIVILLSIGVLILNDRLEKKKLKSIVEDSIKPYRFLRFIATFIAILLFNFFQKKIGTLHLGVAGLFLTAIIAYDYVIKYILQKQPVFWKHRITEWLVIIGFIIFIIAFL